MNPINLRPYQDDSLTGVREYWQSEIEPGVPVRRVLLCAPTGAGKTVMFSAMAQRSLNKSLTNKVLILTNRDELLTQAGGTLSAFGIRYEPITKESKKINTRARCYVAMIETLCRRAKEMPWLLDVNLIIIDECHVGNFKKVFALIKPGTFVIGVTATPLAAKKDDPLTNYYQALVCRVQIPELVQDGFLCPCVTFAPPIDTSNLKIDNSKGDYSDASQLATFAKRQVYDEVLKHYRKACDKYNGGQPMKTVCFNVNIEHSKAVTAMFNEAGISSMHLDADTKKDERKRIIKAYKDGEFLVLNNCGILNAGFDDPATLCVIFNRATRSAILWLQACGRGSRPFPGKSRFVILDMGNNWKEPGLLLWDSERDWFELWQQKKKKRTKEGVTPAKECQNEECGALVNLSATVCPHCGFVFPVKAKPLATAEEFVEVTASMLPAVKVLTDEQKAIKALRYNELKERLPEMSVAQLLEVQDLKAYKSGWALNVIKSRDLDEYEYRDQIEELATLKAYKGGWVRLQMDEYHNAKQMAEVW